MTLLFVLKHSLRNLTLKKTRSFLTMLGIIIGVGAVIAIMAVGASAQNLLLAQVTAMGSNLIGVLPGASDEKGPPASMFGIEITTLKYEDALAMGELPHITAVCSYVKGQGTMNVGRKSKDFSYTGVTPDFLVVEDTAVASGRFIKQDEIDGLSRVVVLGSKVSEEFFGKGDPIGERLKINQAVFTIIGVMKKRGMAFMQDQDSQVFVPVATAQKIMLGIDHLAYVRAKVDSAENIDLATNQIKETLRYRHRIKDPAKDDFSVRSTAQALDILGTITQALKFFLVAVAAISLLVGGIGIMNIIFVSVNERTKEIGLRKAVGAKKGDILIQFLIESSIMTLIGGLLGIVAGILIALIIALGVSYYGYDWKFIVTMPSIIISTLMAVSIGLIFGLWPAYRAAKLNPIEALRKS